MILFPKKWMEAAALLAILALAVYLRLTNLADNPGWYTDEATHVNIAHHLLSGHIQYFAINQSTLLFARPPLFHIALAGWFRLFGEGIAGLRTMTAALGVLSAALLYAVVRRIQSDRVLPLLAAFLLALYPQAVLYSRFGFSYNLLAPFILLAMLGLYRYAADGRRRWLAFAALLLGLAVICDLMALAFLPVLLFVILARNWRDSAWMLIAAVPFTLYAAAMLISAPDAFLFDLRFTLSRLSALSLPGQIENIALNYTTLLSQDFWTLAGVIGLFLLRPARMRVLMLLTFWIPLIVMGRTVALYSLSGYYMIPLLPLIALGGAPLLRWGAPFILRTVRRDITALVGYPQWLATGIAYSIAVLVVVSPLLVTLVLTVNQIRGGYSTAIDPFLIAPNDARQAASYVNAHTTSDAVMIASPAVGWQFTAQTADFQMTVAFTGEETPHLPVDIPADRWVFDPSYSRAKFVVVDNLWRSWGAVHIPGVARLLAEVEESWLLVFESGAIQVYQNPIRGD